MQNYKEEAILVWYLSESSSHKLNYHLALRNYYYKTLTSERSCGLPFKPRYTAVALFNIHGN